MINRIHQRASVVLALLISLSSTSAMAADPLDFTYYPTAIGGAYTLSKPGLADGQSMLYRPYFNSGYWWGDLQAYSVSQNGVVASAPTWSATLQLDGLAFDKRRILTRLDNTGLPVVFDNYDNLSANQQTALVNKDLMNYLRGDRSKEGKDFRLRATTMGHVVRSTPAYVTYDASNNANNRVFVGANDGMLHAFNAATGVEEFAYMPGSILPKLPVLAQSNYPVQYHFTVDGDITVADVTFPNGSSGKVLVGGLGAGGQGLYALNITSTDVATDAALKSKLLWEITDASTGMDDLGYTFSDILIAQVKGTNGARWAAVFGNGYANDESDAHQGSGTSSLFVVDLFTGQLIRKIDTQAGSVASPNGLSSPAAVDVDADDVVDFVYAGDLDGKLWRFDLRDSASSNWSVSNGGNALFQAAHGGTDQAITAAPRVLRHVLGGLQVLVGTGRLLSAADQSDTAIQSMYGLRDTLADETIVASTLVTQSLTESLATDSTRVRTSSNNSINWSTDSGWRIDLPAGERVLTRLQTRSGRVTFTSLHVAATTTQLWLNEVDLVTGGAPVSIIYDVNKDGVTTVADNVGGLSGPTKRVTGVFQGGGLVATSPTLGILDATTGTLFLNRVEQAQLVLPEEEGGGVVGGHFDVDTASFIADIDNGDTDAHKHEYDDSYGTMGIDFFSYFDGSLHEINEDIIDTSQRFKMLVVNSHLSPSGRLSLNQSYLEDDISTYQMVTDYSAEPLASLPVYSLAGVAGSVALTQGSVFFNNTAILQGGLFPTKTGCVRSNELTSNGEWRNGALTVWAVAVNADGTDAFSLTYDAVIPDKIVGITSGLLWETTIFWHWKGPCAHDYSDLDDAYSVASNGDVITIWAHYASETTGFTITGSSSSNSVALPPVPVEISTLPGRTETTTYDASLVPPQRGTWKEVRK